MRDWAKIEPIWRELEIDGLHTPFQRYEWLRAFEKSFANENAAPTFVVAYCGETAVALFPLCIKTSLGVRRLEWIGQRLSDYNAPLVLRTWLQQTRAVDVADIWRSIKACVGNIDICVLSGQPAKLGDGPNPFAQFNATLEASSAHLLQLGGDWDSFAANLFSRSTIRRLKEKRRRLGKSGNLEFHRHGDPVQRAQMAATILDWKGNQLASTGGRNPFLDPRARAFVVAAAGEIEQSYCDVLSASVDGQPIAGIILLKTPRGRLIYQMAYCAGPTSRQSPGQLLLHELMRDMIAADERELDFSVGDEPYKVSLCDEHQAMYVCVKSFSWKGAAVSQALQLGNRLKRNIKASTSMMNALQSAQKHVHALVAWLRTAKLKVRSVSR